MDENGPLRHRGGGGGGSGGCGQMDIRKFGETQSEIIMPDRVQWQIHLGEVHRSQGCSG